MPFAMRHPVLNLLAAALIAAAAVGAPAQEAVRPEVGKPLQAAQELIRSRHFKEALAKVREADAVGGKTANENFLIERMRLAAASGAGDANMAAKAFEAVSGRISPAERLKIIESLAGAYYRASDYKQAMQWCQRYFKEGGTDPSIRTLLIQSQYLAGDFAGAAHELTTEINQTERSGHAPGEDRLKLLMNATLKLNDTNGYVWALEKLVTYYPKRDYWIDLLGRLQRKPNFSDRLALDTYRLSLATGSMTRASDYMEMAQLALQAGFPEEARQVLDKGFADKVLGSGPEAGRQKRLQDLVTKRLADEEKSRESTIAEAQGAKDGTALVNAGLNLVYNGKQAEGLKLIQEGIAHDHLKHDDDARLHLGIAELLSGHAGKAQAAFKTVRGRDGTADLARLWSLYARSK